MLPTSSAVTCEIWTSMRGGSSCVGRPGSPRAAGWGWYVVVRSVSRLDGAVQVGRRQHGEDVGLQDDDQQLEEGHDQRHQERGRAEQGEDAADRKSTRLNSSHANISYAVFCLKKKNNTE